MTCIQTIRNRALQSTALIGLLLLTASPAWGDDPESPLLESTDTPAKGGYYQLKWSLEDADDPIDKFILQESDGDGFDSPRVFYEGADRATVISGRSNGTYHYRVRAVFRDGSRSPWSDPLEVEVAHHSAGQAYGLFVLGGVVFFTTAGMIAAGSIAQRRADRDG
ncbi:MAG: fibronectin type III domain-containing protein [Ectothiorhodospira sp.]